MKPWILPLLAALPLAWGSDAPESASASRDLSERGTAVLDAILGPGRGRVVASARVEVVETRAEFSGPEESEAADPRPAGAAAPTAAADRGALPLPGYARDGAPPTKPAESAPAESLEARVAASGRAPSTRSARTVFSNRGELVRSIRATAFLPAGLDDAAAKAATDAVARALGVDPARGDEVAAVRVPERPAPGDGVALRAFAAAAVLGAIGLFAIAWSVARAARPAEAAARRIVLLPDLERAAIPGTIDDSDGGGIP